MTPPAETEPLLHQQPPDEPSGHFHNTQLQKRKRQKYVLAIVCFSIIAADFGNALAFAPQIAIYESLICERLFGDRANGTSFTGSRASVCKSSPVQDELALLNGWKATFDQIPGIALALPYGLAADRIGRKPVLLMAISGLMLEESFLRLISWWSYAAIVPLRAIWLTPIFQLIGGGPGIATSMAYSIITDIFPAGQRASVYFLMAAAILIGEIVATPLSAALMSWTPWIPSLAGLGCQVVAVLVATCIPETKPPRQTQDEAAEPDAHGDGCTETEPQLQERRKGSSWLATCRQRWNDVRNHSLLTVNMACIVGAFLVASFGSSSISLLIQYASKRFSWSIAKASLLMSIKGSINLFCLLVALPYLSHLLSRRAAPAVKDLRIVQGSVLCWALGFISMALAARPGLFIAGLSVLALGSGFFSALRSLANSLGTQSQIGFINTSIGFSISIGSLIAGPALAAAFKRGMALGGVWSGLPYMIAASLFLAATVLTLGIRPKDTPEAMESFEPTDGYTDTEPESTHDC